MKKAKVIKEKTTNKRYLAWVGLFMTLTGQHAFCATGCDTVIESSGSTQFELLRRLNIPANTRRIPLFGEYSYNVSCYIDLREPSGSPRYLDRETRLTVDRMEVNELDLNYPIELCFNVACTNFKIKKIKAERNIEETLVWRASRTNPAYVLSIYLKDSAISSVNCRFDEESSLPENVGGVSAILTYLKFAKASIPVPHSESRVRSFLGEIGFSKKSDPRADCSTPQKVSSLINDLNQLNRSPNSSGVFQVAENRSKPMTPVDVVLADASNEEPSSRAAR